MSIPVIAVKDERGSNMELSVSSAPGHSQQDTGKKDPGIPGINMTSVHQTIKEEQKEIKNEIKENKSAISRNISEVREVTRESREDFNNSRRNETPVRSGWVNNENEVRSAVHTLLETENITGGIGPYVSAIARDFNNSASSAWKLEERIQGRNEIMRLFFGGDRDAAAELVNLTAQNKARIQQVLQLMNATTMDPDTRAMIQEQVRILQNEQTRLEQLAELEHKDRGLLGWIGF